MASSGVGGRGTRPGSNGPGATANVAGNSGGTRPGMPLRSVMTQSVCAQSASVPSSSRASVRRRAHTLRNPVMAVEIESVAPSETGVMMPSSAARTTHARPRSAYQGRSNPSRSLWIHATSWMLRRSALVRTTPSGPHSSNRIR